MFPVELIKTLELKLLETNSSPLKIGLPKKKVVFQQPIFRGENVSFREGTSFCVAKFWLTQRFVGIFAPKKLGKNDPTS